MRDRGLTGRVVSKYLYSDVRETDFADLGNFVNLGVWG